MIGSTRARETDDHSADRERQRPTQYEADDIAPLGTERHADADLVDALAHGVRHHAIQPNHRQHQRERREHAEQRGLRARLCQ